MRDFSVQPRQFRVIHLALLHNYFNWGKNKKKDVVGWLSLTGSFCVQMQELIIHCYEVPSYDRWPNEDEIVSTH